MSDIEKRKVFITGASSGIGAKTAEALASIGMDVALGAREKASRVNGVADAINANEAWGSAEVFMGDLTVPAERSGLIEDVSEWAGDDGLDLVLNAAGGLEDWLVKEGIDPLTYAKALNSDAQVALAGGFAPAMEGRTIVGVASHWSHLFGQVEMPPFRDYWIVASTKKAGADRIAILPALARRQIRNIHVVGGVVLGTAVGDKGMDDYPEFRKKQSLYKNIVNVGDMALGITAAIVNPNYKTGDEIVIGTNLDKFLKKNALLGSEE